MKFFAVHKTMLEFSDSSKMKYTGTAIKKRCLF